MKKLLFLVLLIALQTNLLKAQIELEWAKQIGGNQSDYPTDFKIDEDDNMYLAGRYTSTSITFGTTTFQNPAGDMRQFLVKYDSLQIPLWAKSFEIQGIIKDISIDNDKNILVTGYFNNQTLTVDSVELFNSDSNATTSDIFLIKYDSFGNLLWAKSFGGNKYDNVTEISIDLNNNIYLTGTFSSDSITFDAITFINSFYYKRGFLVKLNPLGEVIWANTTEEGKSTEFSSLTIDNNGFIYVAGSFRTDSLTFGSVTLFNFYPNNNIGLEIFLLKYNEMGNLIWAKSGGGEADDICVKITTDIQGNIYLAGQSHSYYVTYDSISFISNYHTGASNIIIAKYDSAGNVMWVNEVGHYEEDYITDICTDNQGYIYVTGNFLNQSISFDTYVLNANYYSPGNDIISPFIAKYDNTGKVLWAKTTPTVPSFDGLWVQNILCDNKGNIYSSGYFSDSLDIDLSDNDLILTPNFYDIYITKYKQYSVTGYIYQDVNQNCVQNFFDIGLSNRKATITPSNIMVETNSSGIWSLDSLPIGNYTITFDTSGNWQPTCPTTQSFTVINSDSITFAPSFGFISTQPCAAPSVSVQMPFMRPCFTSQAIYVQACNTNLATGVLANGYVELVLDSLITPTSSSIPYTSLGNNMYSFDVGTLNPGQCVNFSVITDVSCSAVLGQTLCMQANLYPADSCVFDSIPTPSIGGVEPCTLPWDNSSLSVDGWCQSDTVYFSVTNTGDFPNGNMQCYSAIRVFVDGVLTYLDSVLLTGGQTTIFSYFGNGQTWTLQADQHPLHPGNSHPNASVEACGDSTNWTPGLVNTLPLDDADPVVDIYCGVVTGSYDPNDKTGYPLGVGNDHFVAPNGKIDYVIRFQNTGTDTAFTVVVRDTLDIDLDIFSVQSGVSSHDYTFKMFGPRVLEWTFNNILLPDTTTDQDGSNGFVTFTVNQNPNLVDGTVINNSVGIYFDYNDPVITNTTSHIINRGINYLLAVKEAKNLLNNSLFIYPNPTKNLLNIVVPDAQALKIDVYSIDGKLIERKSITKNIIIDVSKYQSGLYFINATNSKGEVFRNKFVKE